MLRLPCALLALSVLLGCPQSIRVVAPADARPRIPDDAAVRLDAGLVSDAEPSDLGFMDASPPDVGFRPDAGPADIGFRDAAFPDAMVPDAGALDPRLTLAPAGNAACYPPGDYTNACPGIAVCRFFDGAEGRCESCTSCGNLYAPCNSGTDCDILFACFGGFCTNFCEVGTFSCGPIEDCLDVGFPGIGVCRPGS